MTNGPVDWMELDRITNHKKELAKEMVSMLANELPTRQQSINEALEKQDWETLLLHAHKLHGSSAYCAAKPLQQLAAELENQLKTQQYDNVPALVDKINTQIRLFLETTRDD